MAELDVQPKRSNPWWLWLLLLLIAIIVVFFLSKGCNSTTTTVGDPDTAKTVAATQPDWNTVDMNVATATDDAITDPGIEVRGNEHYRIYRLGENILFETDQAKLTGAAGDELKQVAASLQKNYPDAMIGVYGHTDATGSAGKNKDLGAERAIAVKDWLTNTGGIKPATISIRSFGESQPVATNATESGRQQNRNVTIVAFPNQ